MQHPQDETSGAAPERKRRIRKRPPPIKRGPNDVLCIITGAPTPIPKRGNRSMYVSRTAMDLHSRLRQVERYTAALVRDVGFTDPAKHRFARMLQGIRAITTGEDDRSHRVRRPDHRASVRLDQDLADRIDSLPGTNRTEKVQRLLLAALNIEGGA